MNPSPVSVRQVPVDRENKHQIGISRNLFGRPGDLSWQLSMNGSCKPDFVLKGAG